MKPKKERNKLIVKLKEKGWSMRKIAQEVGVSSPATIHEIYWREKAKIQTNGQKTILQGVL